MRQSRYLWSVPVVCRTKRKSLTQNVNLTGRTKLSGTPFWQASLPAIPDHIFNRQIDGCKFAFARSSDLAHRHGPTSLSCSRHPTDTIATVLLVLFVIVLASSPTVAAQLCWSFIPKVLECHPQHNGCQGAMASEFPSVSCYSHISC